jgi:hypothetical protein
LTQSEHQTSHVMKRRAPTPGSSDDASKRRGVDFQLARMEAAFSAAAQAAVAGVDGKGSTAASRAPLARFLDGARDSLFTALRGAARVGSAAAPRGAVAVPEPLDRDLAQEVERLEKAVDKLGKGVREAREKVR